MKKTVEKLKVCRRGKSFDLYEINFRKLQEGKENIRTQKKFRDIRHFSQLFGYFTKPNLVDLYSISSTASDQTTTRANLLASSSIVSWAFKRFTPSLRSFVRTSPRFSHFCFWPKPLRQCNLDNPNFNLNFFDTPPKSFWLRRWTWLSSFSVLSFSLSTKDKPDTWDPGGTLKELTNGSYMPKAASEGLQ